MFEMASLYKKPVMLLDPRTGERVKAKSKKWWGRYRDVTGREKRVPLARDKTAAMAMLNELVKKEELKAAGKFDQFDEHRKRPIAEHLMTFRRHLIARNNTTKHVSIISFRLESMFAGCGFQTLSDLAAGRVSEWLAARRRCGEYKLGKRKMKFGVKTSNYYLAAAKQFGQWLVRDCRMRENPFVQLTVLNPRMDVRRRRRTLTDAEVTKLLETTRSRGKFRDLTGRDREMLYLLALNTGLRASELFSLGQQNFDLDANPPSVTVEAAYSKHRRRDVQPLRRDVAERVRAYFAEVAELGRERIWPGTWLERAARMLRKDLEAADIEYRDAEGRVFDFHALRHQFISNLARGGVHPKEARTLARHSTITLTMDRYTHLALADLTSALDRLPALGH
jgi:integrase